MNRWRFPTLSLHGIEGAYADQGGKTVIPRQVIGKFSLRIVPSQTPEQIEKCVTDYIMKLHAESGSANEIKVEMPNGGKPWVADINDPNFQAGRLGSVLKNSLVSFILPYDMVHISYMENLA